MVVQCPSCRSRFRVADDKVTDRGVRLRCTKCKELFHASKSGGAPDGPAEASSPSPPSASNPPPAPSAPPKRGSGPRLFDAEALAQAKAEAAARAAGVRPPGTGAGKPPDEAPAEDLVDEPLDEPIAPAQGRRSPTDPVAPARPRTGPLAAADARPRTAPVAERPRTGPLASAADRPRTGPLAPAADRPRTGPLAPAAERPRTGPLAPADRPRTGPLAGSARPSTDPLALADEPRRRTGSDDLELADAPTPVERAPAPEAAPAQASEPGFGDLELDLGGGGAPPARAAPSAPPQDAGFGPGAEPKPQASPAAAPAPRPRRPRRSAPREPVRSTAGMLLSSALTGLLGGAAALLVLAVAWSGRAAGPERIVPGEELVATRVVSGLYDTAGGQPVFFVRGRVENRGRVARGPVRVVAELRAEAGLDRRAEAVAGLEPTAEDVYGLRSAADSEKLVRGLAQGDAERRIPPGGSLPFFALIREPPEDLEGHRLDVRVEAIDPAPAKARPAAASR